MFDDYIIVNINGQDYYIQANLLKYIKVINNKIVNVSNSQIQLVSDLTTYTSYPRITCSAMSQCRLNQYQGSNYIDLTGSLNYNNANLYLYNDMYLFILMFFVSIYCLYKIMIKR